MTISSSLNAGVAGLNVNATRLATISDNIANSSTNGYKRTDVDFSSMVLNQRSSIYAAGGVRATTFKDISAPGSLISTGSALDIAVNGQGMIPVTDVFGLNQDSSSRKFMMVPTGSFSADEDGFLRTVSGLHMLGWPADESGNIGSVSRDSTSDLVPVNVGVSQFTASPTRSINLGLNLPASSTLPTGTGEPFTLPIEYFDTLGRSHTATFTFTPNVTAGSASNIWSVSVTDSGGDPNATIASFDVEFSDAAGSGGSLLSLTPGAGTTYDAATGQVTFDVITGPINAFVGSPGDSKGLTQLEAPFSPYDVTKDGAPIGNLQTVEIDAKGYVQAVYDTGFRRTLYQIPVSEVPNPNGMKAQNNQAYSVSPQSGDVYFWDAGSGPAGSYSGYALMESNTDIAAELTSLIETQRAYSSNAKIIQTVDEMLQETTNLKR